jgi:hypothetical protein
MRRAREARARGRRRPPYEHASSSARASRESSRADDDPAARWYSERVQCYMQRVKIDAGDSRRHAQMTVVCGRACLCGLDAIEAAEPVEVVHLALEVCRVWVAVGDDVDDLSRHVPARSREITHSASPSLRRVCASMLCAQSAVRASRVCEPSGHVRPHRARDEGDHHDRNVFSLRVELIATRRKVRVVRPRIGCRPAAGDQTHRPREGLEVHLGWRHTHKVALSRAVVDRRDRRRAQPKLGVPRVKRRLTRETQHPQNARKPVADHQHLRTRTARLVHSATLVVSTRPRATLWTRAQRQCASSWSGPLSGSSREDGDSGGGCLPAR